MTMDESRLLFACEYCCLKFCSSFFDSWSMMRASFEKLRCFWFEACRMLCDVEPVVMLPREPIPECGSLAFRRGRE